MDNFPVNTLSVEQYLQVKTAVYQKESWKLSLEEATSAGLSECGLVTGWIPTLWLVTAPSVYSGSLVSTRG